MSTLVKILAGLLIAAGGGIGALLIHPTTQQFGSFNPTGGGTYLLQSSISASQNTITLTSFTEPGSGIPYTMSYIGSDIIYGTISPSSNNSEFISATGITQNGNGTATLTGVLRGESRTPGTGGCVASSTLAHAYPGQTQFILSNSPCFYSEFATRKNTQSITGLWTFSSTSPPKYDGYGPNFGNFPTTTLASVSYVDITASQAATNFWSIVGNDITNNNSGKVNVAKNLNILDSNGATSTFMGPISFLGGTGGQPYVLIATGTPPYGYIPGDLIDAGNSTNGFAAINTFNSSGGTCASSNFVMNGNIGNVNSDYTDIGFTNTGWTGVGVGCLSALTGVKPESTYIYNPTGEMDFVLGTTTTSYGFNWFTGGGAAANKLMSLSGTGALTLNGVSMNRKFGGTGADGALTLTSGTTTVSLGGASYVEKNYSSISITGTGHLAFSNPAAGGTFIVIRSQGNTTLTCSPAPCIDISGMGSAGAAQNTGNAGTAANLFFEIASNAGGGGSGATPGAAGAAATTLTLPTAIPATSTLMKYGDYFWVGAGGGSGNAGGSGNLAGAGGYGGGGLLLEVGGAWNFTTANGIYATGLNGAVAVTSGTCAISGGGGGGGGGGFVKVLYNTLTANSGTINVSGGTGGNNGAAPCTSTSNGGGGGGGSGSTVGNAGTQTNTANAKTGGDGGAGKSNVEKNNDFF